MNQRKLLLIALLVLAALLLLKPSCLSPTSQQINTVVSKATKTVAKAKDVVSTAIAVPIGQLKSIPKMIQSGPPGFSEGFGNIKNTFECHPSFGHGDCLQRVSDDGSEAFGQEVAGGPVAAKGSSVVAPASVSVLAPAPAAGACPGFSEMCRAAAKESPLLNDDSPRMGFGSADGEEGNYATIAETLANATGGDWVGNFKNDAGANSTYLSTFGTDPSRQTAIKAPNATINSSIRADEKINFDPAAICKLSGRLSKLQSNQGL